MKNDENIEKFAILIPAYNEEASIGILLKEVFDVYPNVFVVVVNDGSHDNTSVVARDAGAMVLDLPCNLGVGGAIQLGYKYLYKLGFETVVRIDGDGQHNPADIQKLLSVKRETGVDLVIGSRFLGDKVSGVGTGWRKFGNITLAKFLSIICRAKITDPTSGFWCVSGSLLRYFAFSYPTEYPEPEALALMRRQGYVFKEVYVVVRARQYGVSSISAIGTLYFALKVGVALVADRLRPIDSKYAKRRVKGEK